MTTFSEAEVLFLQAHGNEVRPGLWGALPCPAHPAHTPLSPPRPPQACRRVWLGTFDPRTSLLPDSRDPQKVKEFLQEKYEKKRW